ADGDRRLVLRQLDRRGEGGLRQAELPGQHLADLVGVAVDRLLAHEDEVRLLRLDDRRQGGDHHAGVEVLVLGVDPDGAVGAHGERAAQLLRGVLRADGDDHHLAVAGALGGVLDQPQGGLDRVLVEGVDHPGGAGQVDGSVLDLGLELRVWDPLERDEDLHDVLLSRPLSTRDPIAPAARTISNFSPRPNSHASASSSSMPNTARATTGAGISESNAPASWPLSTTPARILRKSPKRGFWYSFMNFALCRSSTVSTSASAGLPTTSAA